MRTILRKYLTPVIGLHLALVTLHHEAHGQVVIGQVDDFETSLAGWHAGVAAPVPPTLVPNAGPNGAGDDAMQITSFGAAGPGRTLVAINNANWRGDYLGQGASSISLDLRNTGATPLTIRLAFRGPDSSTYFVTNLGYDLNSGSAWQSAQFSLSEASVTRVQGTQSYATTFGSLSELRILHNPSLAFRGESIAGTLLVDNITAVPEPTATTGVLAVAAAITTAVLGRRNRRAV